MNDDAQRKVAEALEATPELMPFIPELFADIWVLGSSPDIVADMLHPLSAHPKAVRALELGCGKGAVAITLALKLGIRILGIDIYQPFISEAGKRASEMGADDLCSFACCDMHDVVLKAKGFDAVVYAGVGGVLGNYEQCVEKLRRCVRPDGFMVIDDGFLSTDRKIDLPGYEHYVPHKETLEQIVAHGDILLREEIISAEEIRAYNQKNTELIRTRAKELTKTHPEAANVLADYVRREEIESEILETEVTGAIWLLKRTES